MPVRIGVVVFPGSNCDRDTLHALDLAGAEPVALWHEAATLDGASRWQLFRHVTLPLLTPIIAITMTFSVLLTFTDFQLIYVLTRGGPVNATHLMATLSFQRGISGGQLGEGAATILCEYPANVAALARRKPSDPRVAERFELYACGVELANGYSELTEASEQRRRFESDRALHSRLYGQAPPVDEDFLAAVEALPPCAGVALGFDRLVMLAARANDITDVLWAPVV